MDVKIIFVSLAGILFLSSCVTLRDSGVSAESGTARLTAPTPGAYATIRLVSATRWNI